MRDQQLSHRYRDSVDVATQEFLSVARSSTMLRSIFTAARIPTVASVTAASRCGTSRPAITAAALAALYNAGDYDGEHVPDYVEVCSKQSLHDLGGRSFGHWHYTYLYYSQVVYRQGDELWKPFRDRLYDKIVGQQRPDGSWQGQVHPVYVTACNLIMLQLDKGYLAHLPTLGSAIM